MNGRPRSSPIWPPTCKPSQNGRPLRNGFIGLAVALKKPGAPSRSPFCHTLLWIGKKGFNCFRVKELAPEPRLAPRGRVCADRNCGHAHPIPEGSWLEQFVSANELLSTSRSVPCSGTPAKAPALLRDAQKERSRSTPSLLRVEVFAPRLFLLPIAI
jgi:hypothetical protein